MRLTIALQPDCCDWQSCYTSTSVFTTAATEAVYIFDSLSTRKLLRHKNMLSFFAPILNTQKILFFRRFSKTIVFSPGETRYGKGDRAGDMLVQNLCENRVPGSSCASQIDPTCFRCNSYCRYVNVRATHCLTPRSPLYTECAHLLTKKQVFSRILTPRGFEIVEIAVESEF